MIRKETALDRFSEAVTRDDATKSVQIKFRAPAYLGELIDTTAARRGWGASEEVRRRLVRSYEDETQAVDDETYRLLHAIKTIAANSRLAFGDWSGDRFAFDTFRAALIALVDLHRPAGVPIRPSEGGIADMYLGEDGTPETAGRIFAGMGAAAANIPTPGRKQP